MSIHVFRPGRLWAALLVVVFCCGCGVTGPKPTWEPSFSVRKDFYNNAPVWESKLFESPAKPSSRDLKAWRGGDGTDPRAAIAALAKVSPSSAPGLYVLLKQVDPTDSEGLLIDDASRDAQVNAALNAGPAVAAVSPKLMALKTVPGEVKTKALKIVAANPEPLPTMLRDDPIVRRYVLSLGVSHYNARLQSLSLLADVEPPAPHIMKDETFTLKQMRDTSEKMATVNLELVRPPTARAKAASLSTLDATKPENIKWDWVAFEYFAAYYKGKFVDRGGGKLSKPELGKKIGNETIVNALTVGLESIADFAVLAGSIAGGDQVIRAPIVYSGGDRS